MPSCEFPQQRSAVAACAVRSASVPKDPYTGFAPWVSKNGRSWKLMHTLRWCTRIVERVATRGLTAAYSDHGRAGVDEWARKREFPVPEIQCPSARSHHGTEDQAELHRWPPVAPRQSGGTVRALQQTRGKRETLDPDNAEAKFSLILTQERANSCHEKNTRPTNSSFTVKAGSCTRPRAKMSRY